MIYELLALRAAHDPDLAARDRDEELCAMTWTASRLVEADDMLGAEQAYRSILNIFPDDPLAAFMMVDCRSIRTFDRSIPETAD